MPTARKLTDEEVEQLTRGKGPVDLTPYAERLQELAVGDWGIIELEPSDRVIAIKRRATVAARQQGKRLVWKRLRDNLLPFEVRAVAAPPAPAPPPAPAKGRGQGRARGTGTGTGRRQQA